VKWATREHIHLDRVACCWLIQRYLDPEAELSFIDAAGMDQLPAGTVTFGIAGGTFTPHDGRDTTFARMLRHYRETIPAAALPGLEVMTHVIDAGVRAALGHDEDPHCPPELRSAGAGLAALSEGFMFLADGDEENLERSRGMYDALYAYCAGHALTAAQPELANAGLMQRLLALKERLQLAGGPR
jgi:hypothetical protein